MTADEALASENGPWGDALAILWDWDPQWTQACLTMSNSPWTSGVLDRRFVELVSVALSAACTNLDAQATRWHMRAALDAGATREEILLVLKCATVLAIHLCSLAAPILLEEAHAAGVEPPAHAELSPTPACDAMRAVGQWNTAWDPFAQLDPGWTELFIATGSGVYDYSVLSAKEVELLSIALGAAYTHMYEPGTRRHIRAALQAGATVREIMEILKLCVAHGVQACNVGVPILAEELTAVSTSSADTGS